MFKTASGISIPFPDIIKEEFEINDKYLDMNLSIEKFQPFLLDFLNDLIEPLFLIIEIPVNKQKEEELSRIGETGFHYEVFYKDGCNKENITSIIHKYGAILINDGSSRFGIASHKTRDELFIHDYKIIQIFSENIQQYQKLMQKYNIHETQNLITAWNTISRNAPGERRTIKVDGKNIYDVVEELKKDGLYSAEIKNEK